MEYRDIAIGVVIGVLIGAAAIYVINQSKISQLNKAVDELEAGIDSLNEALDAKQAIIDSQEDTLEAVTALQAEVEAKDRVIEEYDALVEELTEDVSQLNLLYAIQTYRAEEALTLLHDYLPEYESKIDFAAVYGDLTFDEWWAINGGPAEEWSSLVYG